MEKTWWFEADGQRNGPVSESEIEKRLGKNEIGAKTLVWTEGQGPWQELGMTTLSSLLKGPPELPKTPTPPELPNPAQQVTNPNATANDAEKIELIKIKKNSAKMVPASILSAIIGFIAVFVTLVLLVSLAGSFEMRSNIIVTVLFILSVIIGIVVWTVLEDMARNRIYDVELIYADGHVVRQSDGSSTTRALPWHEFFRRAMNRYADQHDLSAADTLIKAQAFYDMSGIKSRKIQLR